MAAPYHDLYTNHFANIRCSRPTFLGFLNYTVTALADSPTAALKALHPGLLAAATALSDARVNSAIGGFWPSRIKGIDQQIRAHAAAMNPEQQAATYLDILLPVS